MTRARASALSLALLGASISRRGLLSVASMAISALTVLALCGLALSYARRGDDAPLSSVPVLASSATAWGGAFLQAVVVSLSVFRRDRTDGVLELFVTRTASLREYMIARVGGLALLLAAAVFGGTLIVGVVSMLASSRGSDLLAAAGSSIGALAYGLAFAAVMAPVALAALGARSRGGGYLVLLLVVIVPEYVAGKLDAWLPSEVTELCAIPSALAALRSSLSLASFDLLRAVRALVAVAAMIGVALFFVRRDVVRIERGQP